jgi:hypothetical protein
MLNNVKSSLASIDSRTVLCKVWTTTWASNHTLYLFRVSSLAIVHSSLEYVPPKQKRFSDSRSGLDGHQHQRRARSLGLTILQAQRFFALNLHLEVSCLALPGF